MAEDGVELSRWRRSSCSGAEHNACVEVNRALDTLRDSKNTRPRLRGDVLALVTAIRCGRLDR